MPEVKLPDAGITFDSIIYVIAPPPGTEKTMQEKMILPHRFSDFRDGLLAMAAERNLYFLDFYALIIDEEGYMMRNYECGDGLHPNPFGYELLEQLIRTHTVDCE